MPLWNSNNSLKRARRNRASICAHFVRKFLSKEDFEVEGIILLRKNFWATVRRSPKSKTTGALGTTGE